MVTDRDTAVMAAASATCFTNLIVAELAWAAGKKWSAILLFACSVAGIVAYWRLFL